MSNLELFVNGTNDTVGKINLHGDEPIQLNISVTDIKDISKRNSTFSQTFTIPADKNNNILLNHIFNIGSDSTFDPTKKTPCYMLNDTVPIFTGTFQLTKINVKNANVLGYECVVYGDVIDLVKSLGDKLIIGNTTNINTTTGKSNDDLNFTELDHNRDLATIMNSWTEDTKTLGYYYPLIDYGYDLDLQELNSGTLSISVINGTVTSATALTLVDSTQSWQVNFFSATYAEYSISIIGGTGQGQTRYIQSNTAISITLYTAWAVQPDASSLYSINKLDASNPYNTTGNGLAPSIFKPALSNSFLIKKIFNSAGFVLDSTFVDSDVFAETIIPYNGSDIGSNLEDIRTFQAFLSVPLSTYHPTTSFPLTGIQFPFDDDFDRGYDRRNLYNTTTFSYTVPVNSLSCIFYTQLSYKYNITYLPPGEVAVDQFFIRYYKNGAALPFHLDTIGVDRCPGYYFSGPAGTSPAPAYAPLGEHTISTDTGTLVLNAGDVITCKIYVNSTNTLYQIFNTNSVFYNRILTNGVVDNYIQMNNYVPKNIKQIDYVKSVITMFNLMAIPDKDNPKKIKLIPRTEYYATGVVKDWSQKVDHTTQIQETLVSEQQAKKIKLTYKADKDYYNVFYTDKTKLVYGEHTNIIDNEWITGENIISTTFSPTPITKVFGSTKMFVSKICKRDDKSGIYGTVDSNIRFLRKNKNLMSSGSDGFRILGMTIPLNAYPYAGHLDNPTDPTIDYNFGKIEWAFYPELTGLTPNNLVENYWQEYLDDISDKNSKLVKCMIYLTPNDIAQFDYNDKIFIDGLTDDGGHYYNVNKITYIPTSNVPSIVELIKVDRIPTKKKRFTSNIAMLDMNPINFIGLGADNTSGTGQSMAIGKSNTIGTNSPNSIILGGNNNTIANNTPGVSIINSSNHYVNTPFVTIVGNTYFNPDGTSYVLYNDIDCGLNEVIDPFATNAYNDIDCGVDAVLNIGSSSPLKDIDEGEDAVIPV